MHKLEEQVADLQEALVNVENATKRLLGDLDQFKGEIASVRVDRDHVQQELDRVKQELAHPELKKAQNDLLVSIAKEQSEQSAKLEELRHEVIAAKAELEGVEAKRNEASEHHDRIEASIASLRHRLTRQPRWKGRKQ